MSTTEHMSMIPNMDSLGMKAHRLASIVYHVFMVLGQLGVLYTIFHGITAWTINAAFLLLLAGLLTLVYPHVGVDPRLTPWVWGQPRRALSPWLAMTSLLLICLLLT